MEANICGILKSSCVHYLQGRTRGGAGENPDLNTVFVSVSVFKNGRVSSCRLDSNVTGFFLSRASRGFHFASLQWSLARSGVTCRNWSMSKWSCEMTALRHWNSETVGAERRAVNGCSGWFRWMEFISSSTCLHTVTHHDSFHVLIVFSTTAGPFLSRTSTNVPTNF